MSQANLEVFDRRRVGCQFVSDLHRFAKGFLGLLGAPGAQQQVAQVLQATGQDVSIGGSAWKVDCQFPLQSQRPSEERLGLPGR